MIRTVARNNANQNALDFDRLNMWLRQGGDDGFV